METQPKKTFAQIRAILDQIEFIPTDEKKHKRTFRFEQVSKEDADHFFLQVTYKEKDINTGKMEKQGGRKWLISPFMTDTEIVETAFTACVRSMLHVTKEHFKYKGERVYSPHFDVEARFNMCRRKEYETRLPIPNPSAAKKKKARARIR